MKDAIILGITSVLSCIGVTIFACTANYQLEMLCVTLEVVFGIAAFIRLALWVKNDQA